MAFTFGPAIPSLFLYAALGMVILYVTNRLRIAYSVRRLPNYGKELNSSIEQWLYYCPYAYALIGSWLYSNQQALNNVVLPNKTHYEYNAPTGHQIGNLFDSNVGLTPGWIFTIALILFLIWLGFMIFVHIVARRCFNWKIKGRIFQTEEEND